MKKITTDEKKMQLVERLVKEGVIDFTEAIMLLEVETVTEFVEKPFSNPFQRIGTGLPPWDTTPVWYGNSRVITCAANEIPPFSAGATFTN